MFERFLLGVPYLFLKKIPYAWIGIVVFFTWPPIASGILAAIVLLGLIAMNLQEWAWERMVLRDFSAKGRKAFFDRPHTSLSYKVRNLLLLLAASAVAAYFFDGWLGLTGIQWCLLIFGFMLLYKDSLLLGSPTVYIVTDRGIGVRYIPGHVDYRLFFSFKEIGHVVRMLEINHVPERWSLVTPTDKVKAGLLLVPVDPEGFSRRLKEVLLSPENIEEFTRWIPGGLLVEHT